jgi:hypothetical protein
MGKKIFKAILLLLLGGGLGIGGVWLWQNFELRQREEVMTVASPTPADEVPVASMAPAVSALPQALADPYVGWLTYTNSKHDYGFKYSGSWSLNDSMPGSNQYDRVVVQGDIATKGWPSIDIGLGQPAATLAEVKTYLESLFGGGMTIENTVFGQGMISAVKMSSAASPQAYATESFYFIHKGVVLKINLNDTSATEAKPIYQHFLDEFEVF